MNIRDLLEAVATEEERDNPRSIAQREALGVAAIGGALAREIRRAPDFIRGSDKQRMERHLDEIDMAVKRVRGALKQWKS